MHNKETWRLDKEIDLAILGLVKRRSEDTYDKDLLQLILGSAKNYGDNGNLPADITPNKFIVDNCKNIYFASHETTAISASWCLMLLASHPEWQARARAEVLEIYGLRFSTADTLRSLKTARYFCFARIYVRFEI
ncbi:Cytochrome [Abeliophyllum distichum]|uniref:Cytochrome n=1 Tax=Abeliophyllum distichum TaxID=126358 RepID=A0ABD1V8Y1_9LAMI